jgi:HEAT repeats
VSGPFGHVALESKKGSLIGHHCRTEGLVETEDGRPWEVYLKVERRGDELRSYISSDGKEWSLLSRDELPDNAPPENRFAREVRVGVVASNWSKDKLKVTFDQWKLTRLKPEANNARRGRLPKIDPDAPLAALLPAPPGAARAPVYLGGDLSAVLELALEDFPQLTAAEWRERKAHTAAAALHLNGREEDGFLKAALKARPDLAGLPVAMGAACRTTGERAKAFKNAAVAVQSAMGSALLGGPGTDEVQAERFYRAHLAVVEQVMPAHEPPARKALIRALASVPSPEATRALARLAVFSPDKAVRAAAVEALAVRREEDSTEVLAAGLRYPWPGVAENAASAIAKLKRKDLAPQLRAMLTAPDPRGPRAEAVCGRRETVAYELVRVNHLRNCLLCHAPAERGKTEEEALVAEVPVPAGSLPDTSAGYGLSRSNLLVRVDVTYLRQDFSSVQEVKDWSANSWPPKQRFDFLLRRRVLGAAEGADLRKRLAAGESPYHRAAALALRELGERDPEAKAGVRRGPF